MEQFKVSEEGYKKFQKKYFRIMIPAMVVVLIILIASGIVSSKAGEFNPTFIVAPVVIAIFGSSFYRGIRKQKRMILSYCLTITDSEITREQLNTPPLSISFMEIKEIIRGKKGGYIVKGMTGTDIIYIPLYAVDDAGALEERLKTFSPITEWTDTPWHLKYRSYLIIPMLGAAIATFAVDNVYVSVPCGVITLGVTTWILISVIRSKNVPVSAKRRIWIFVLYIVMVIYMLYTKLGGPPLWR